jgi:hypothetical protein
MKNVLVTQRYCFTQCIPDIYPSKQLKYTHLKFFDTYTALPQGKRETHLRAWRGMEWGGGREG